MGKPFENELEKLPETYHWAADQPIEKLSRAVEGLSCTPLLALGSGGSFTVSQFACQLHREVARQSATACSPLQATSLQVNCSDLSVFIPTAGGNNPDVLGAVQGFAEREPRNLTVLCAASRSRVSSLATRYQFINLAEYPIPSGRDGFLATNSLLAFAVLLARAYCESHKNPARLPNKFDDLLEDRSDLSRPERIDRRYQRLWECETLVVLHGASTVAAAIDLESKFTEAALGNVQIADFRQFAHGRHHWLAKRSQSTAVVALISERDKSLAEQTLALLPSGVPVHRIEIAADGWLADLTALARVLPLVGSAGRARGIDPGRPGVPPFGQRLYHLNAFQGSPRSVSLARIEQRAIERKAGVAIEKLEDAGTLSLWRHAFSEFTRSLLQARFPVLVADYDGTLCDEHERFGPLPKDIATGLQRFLKGGITLGIATGRGKSVRQSLRDAFPKRMWSHVLVGYYNGGEVATLADDNCPDGEDRVGPDLAPIRAAFESDDYLAAVADCTYRSAQITLSPRRGTTLNTLWQYVAHLVLRIDPVATRAMRSGHSIDIVPRRTSKLAVVNFALGRIDADSQTPVLCIGDRGCWPGNDFELLGGNFGLSVYETSPDPHRCWNLCPPGQRGKQATLTHFQQLVVTKQGLRLRLPGTKKGDT